MRTFSTATVRESGTARRWRSPTFSTELFLGSSATFARAAPRRAPSASRHASHARSPAAASGGAQRRGVLPDVGADVDDEVDVVGAQQPGAALGRREAEARER
jgi:hypothetical protein